ncbi:PREDICTED: uncharacterized protein LOC104611621 [Nelumbo nucifera]|uniref:Uncharacterized protein LOC104611621 n=1 Tax=Nelumbo nucifera TaxID=4432 RepID=A0A1U8B7N9_NELNU|nr:PREDICTED: uncharacterized protein LOC104611621 [Nelumbo nucifera]
MELSEDLLDDKVLYVEVAKPWQLYFDRASSKQEARIGIVFVTPSGELIPYSFSLTSLCSNNIAEYEAIIVGLEIAREMNIEHLQVYGDSQLVVIQLNELYGVKHLTLIPYFKKAKELVTQFTNISIGYIPRSENDKADALAKLAASLILPEEKELQITIGERRILPSYRIIPIDPRRSANVQCQAVHFRYINGTLYGKSIDGILLKCLSEDETLQALHEVHAEDCNVHQDVPKMHAKSASYNPSPNGQAEAFNKVLCKILKKMVSKNKRGWHESCREDGPNEDEQGLSSTNLKTAIHKAKLHPEVARTKTEVEPWFGLQETSQEHLVAHILPLLVRSYDDNDARIQEEVLKVTISLAKKLDIQMVKQEILPRVHGLALKTTVAVVRVNALLCLGELVHMLDKHAVLDILQTIQRCTAVDRSAPTLMCTLGIASSITKQYSIEFTAEHVLPLLMPLLVAQQLNVQQFAKYMLFLKDVLRKIEEKRGVILTDSGTPEVRVTPIANGFQSGALMKPSGTFSSKKRSSAWDGDWDLITKEPTSPVQSSTASVSTTPMAPDSHLSTVTITQVQSVTSTTFCQQKALSCTEVDIEWPARTASDLAPQVGDNEKENQSSGASTSSFDDIDPFADWPPRPSNSVGDLGSSTNNTISLSMNKYGYWLNTSGQSGTSTNSKPIGLLKQESSSSNANNHSSSGFNTQSSIGFSRQNQGNNPANINSLYTEGLNPQASIGFLKSNQVSSAMGLGKNNSLMGSYAETKAADLGSIFAPAKSEQTAPRLAPPPQTAVGMGRGSGNQGHPSSIQTSRSVNIKSSTNQPILDLL